jgi:hypothetical protein
MALVGGGGAGNTAGSNPTGTSKGLNHLGNHAYAYSGLVATSGSSFIEHLNFTTGSSYLVGHFDFIGATVESDPADGKASIMQVQFNGETVIDAKVQTNPEVMPANYNANVIIPPYTHVVASCRSGGSGANTEINIIGRVYE